MNQYEMLELTFSGPEPEGSHVQIDLTATFCQGEQSCCVKGFYCGGGVYKVRYMPLVPGKCAYSVRGCVEAEGILEIGEAREGCHGPVKAEGSSFVHRDGKLFHPFGTTVYAMVHQEEALIQRTMQTLEESPFNKLRLCVFPKDYDYNKNEPPFYPFRKTEAGKWDVHHPDFAFWDHLEHWLKKLGEAGIQADLILFHPYDRWGFSTMTREEDLLYLDYLLRRFSAMPHIWWSLANEYDFTAKEPAHWQAIEEFTAENDPFHHLLSCHNAYVFWDFTRPNVTHASIQSKIFTNFYLWAKQYKKPIMLDECCYEGDLPHIWGSISAKEMTARFWRAVVSGAYCTHGETFLSEDDILWWSRGGVLKGSSAPRIAFLRDLVESLPGKLEHIPSFYEQWMVPEEEREEILKGDPVLAGFARRFWKLGEGMQEFAASEYTYEGRIGEACYLSYLDIRTCSRTMLRLPGDKTYRLELIDTWNMTREVIREHACGNVEIALPGREHMAVLAMAETE